MTTIIWVLRQNMRKYFLNWINFLCVMCFDKRWVAFELEWPLEQVQALNQAIVSRLFSCEGRVFVVAFELLMRMWKYLFDLESATNIYMYMDRPSRFSNGLLMIVSGMILYVNSVVVRRLQPASTVSKATYFQEGFLFNSGYRRLRILYQLTVATLI